MNVIPYLNFDGNCREAFDFYGQLLGGEPQYVTFGDAPADEQMPAEMADGVMNVYLQAGDIVLMGSDAFGGRYERPRGIYVSLQVGSVEEGVRIFEAFANGGKVIMPLEPTFWVERFGMVVDRFGTPWMVNAGKPAEDYA